MQEISRHSCPLRDRWRICACAPCQSPWRHGQGGATALQRTFLHAGQHL